METSLSLISATRELADDGNIKLPAVIDWKQQREANMVDRKVVQRRFKYVDTICLRCLKSGIPLMETVHNGCDGLVLVAHEDFWVCVNNLSNGKVPEGLDVYKVAKKNVEDEISKLKRDSVSADKIRARYNGGFVKEKTSC